MVRSKSNMSAGGRGGVAALILAAMIWGCFPLYWHWLGFTDTVDILANRALWSFVVGLILIAVIDRRIIPAVPESLRETCLILLAAGVLSFNWGVSIYAVQVERVVEGGIGMYFAPIFKILLGMLLFREAISKTKIITILMLIISLAILVIELGTIPTIAIGMGLSFAIYGSIKKTLSLPSRDSFVLEAAIMALPALLYLSMFDTALVGEGSDQTMLLIGAGLIAAPPLILYGFGNKRTSLAASGVIMTGISMINILVGWLLLGEQVTVPTAASILIIAVAATFYSIKASENGRRFEEDSHHAAQSDSR